jgi:hypothetical protein
MSEAPTMILRELRRPHSESVVSNEGSRPLACLARRSSVIKRGCEDIVTRRECLGETSTSVFALCGVRPTRSEAPPFTRFSIAGWCACSAVVSEWGEVGKKKTREMKIMSFRLSEKHKSGNPFLGVWLHKQSLLRQSVSFQLELIGYLPFSGAILQRRLLQRGIQFTPERRPQM